MSYPHQFDLITNQNINTDGGIFRLKFKSGYLDDDNEYSGKFFSTPAVMLDPETEEEGEDTSPPIKVGKKEEETLKEAFREKVLRLMNS